MSGPINNWYKNNSEFGKSKMAGYPNSTIAPIPEVDLNFLNEPILNRVNNKYFQNNNLVFNPSDYSQNPNFIGPSLYNQPINGQNFATYINNPNNGYKISNEEEEYDAGEDWRNAELERRKKNTINPIEQPNYLEQASNALKPYRINPDTAGLIKDGVSTVSGKSAEDLRNSNKIQNVGAAVGLAGNVGKELFNNSMSDNQKAIYSEGLFGKNQFIDNLKNVNTSYNATNFGDLNGQHNNAVKNINQYKTDTLNWKQQGLNVGSSTAQGFAAGLQTGNIYAAIGMAAANGTKALAEGINANNKIRDVEDMRKFKLAGAGNSMIASAQNVRNIYANNKKSDMFNNQAYYGANGGYLYANGGLMNPYGINVFNNGKLHSQNKYGGVPVSIAEDGKPNLVEEGEVLFDDYVYSNRIKINDTIRRRLKLKDSTKTFADAAKEVKERGDDRPNDPVTEKTIKAQMQFLKSEQDKKKEQQEEREQQKMLAQMNEQQLQAMQEQQMNEEADAYEQQMAQEQMAQQAPQEQQMVNPQMQEQMMAQQQQPQQQMFANGGNLKGGSNDADAHRFVKGTRIKKGKEADIKSNRLKLLMDFYDQIENDEKLTDDQKQQEIDKFIKSINNTQDSHKAISSGKDINNVSFDQAVKDFQDRFRYNDDLFSSDMFESLGNVDENSNHDRFASWTPDGYYSAITKERNIGVGDNYFTEDELKQINDRFGKYGYTWSNTENSDDNDKYYRFTKKQGKPETTEKTYKGGYDELPNYNWRYKQTPVPGLIDSYLAARAFAPADYSRANSIINTPIRDIQYTPNGGYIAPYIIDPRLQYQMNADLGAATNRGLVNNAGGNSAAAQAALLANNRQISQSAANLGYQADAQNAAQIQAAQQFNNAVDAQNAQGFLSAAEANQRADVQRGEFNYYGQNMKENIDAQRGQAISNSLQSLSDDYMNYYKDRYNQGMVAGLVDSGYFGEPTPFLRQQTGWNPNGTFTRNNYLIDDNGNKHYIVNNADGTVAFANPNDDLISKNKGKKLVFNNGEYKFVG